MLWMLSWSRSCWNCTWIRWRHKIATERCCRIYQTSSRGKLVEHLKHISHRSLVQSRTHCAVRHSWIRTHTHTTKSWSHLVTMVKSFNWCFHTGYTELSYLLMTIDKSDINTKNWLIHLATMQPTTCSSYPALDGRSSLQRSTAHERFWIHPMDFRSIWILH